MLAGLVTRKVFNELVFKTQVKNGNQGITLVNHLKHTFRISVSCNLPHYLCKSRFFISKQKKGLLRNVN